MNETHTRSIIKGISYRIIGASVTTATVFVFTGNTTASLGIGLTEALIKTIIFYSHERVWLNIKWGKKYIKK
ncbi:MAG: Adenylyl-sulfate kinase [Parcubacteria group bacterium GW2011_GWD2_38_12]|nr:MAG: Adenylyl-sulfate kinase [Parcubacteria group bacterium GW2011_GWD2_38_12]